MSTATAKKTNNREQVCALWKRQSKEGKVYFSGKVNGTDENLTGFYNTNKKNLKEPDLRVYLRDREGNLSTGTYLDLWCNPTKTGKKILTGKLNGKRVVGFINENGNEKAPYISIYVSDELPVAPEKEATKKAPKKAKKVEEEVEDDLPF